MTHLGAEIEMEVPRKVELGPYLVTDDHRVGSLGAGPMKERPEATEPQQALRVIPSRVKRSGRAKERAGTGQIGVLVRVICFDVR